MWYWFAQKIMDIPTMRFTGFSNASAREEVFKMQFKFNVLSAE